MACSSGCPTPGAHASWGECLRSKSLQVADVTAHQFNTGQHRQIKEYVRAREAGIQPDSVFKRDVDKAVRITEKTGTPYRADK
jgi:hypothetical protein